MEVEQDYCPEEVDAEGVYTPFFMATFGETADYRNALKALADLKAELGISAPLKAIARALIAGNQAVMPQRRFPYVGEPLDPRDRAVSAAYEAAWQDFLAGDDIGSTAVDFD